MRVSALQQSAAMSDTEYWRMQCAQLGTLQVELFTLRDIGSVTAKTVAG